MGAEKADEVVGTWRDVARVATGVADIELAAPFQRHMTVRGTGLPASFCLALTPSQGALAFKFNPRNRNHPLEVKAGQIKKAVVEWLPTPSR